MSAKVSLVINGEQYRLDLPPETPLLYVLRNDLCLNGAKFGCGLGQCGACSVIVDGLCARSCVLPIGRLEGRSITTLEGLGTAEQPDVVQEAFIHEQAAQCGYCLNGMIMATKALLAANPAPTDDEIREALKFNLCRCGTHVEILRAVKRAAEQQAVKA
ncbi:(2Fe-2S)-binding protein [Marinobacterium lutimaris]|uniref:Nicotinate dehydrogenase subunit A n=1 Tax=Marinobacterium lutimaris TaxID=568106 RepID=A0A1H6DRF5_9GAMM|nr:(2Fe-2S)-binding protein [Marinobacterium lutimaris]SEG87205.1 nicotinate dehydrogenase subunit A [Marinobacterium lutimaris]